jgi:hypothetical protein
MELNTEPNECKEPVSFCMKCSCGKEHVLVDNLYGNVNLNFYREPIMNDNNTDRIVKNGYTMKFSCTCNNSITLYIKRSRINKIKSLLLDEDE